MFNLLKSEYDETRSTLKDVEENIRRITGRDPDQFTITSDGNIQLKNEGRFPGKNSTFQQKKRSFSFPARFGKPGEKEEEENVIEEESPDEDVSPVKKPTLQSTVVATGRNAMTRRDTLKEQKRDSKGLARNRRMFGFVLGTLQKFQSEESTRRVQTKKRAEIDKKVEEATEKEKELMQKEKEQMFILRREKQMRIRCLEKKMEIAEIHDVWERNHKLLMNFVQTSAKPCVMFLPSKHNMKSQKALKKSQERIKAVMKVHNDKIEAELAEIDKWYTKDDNDETEEVGEKGSTSHEGVESQNNVRQEQAMNTEETQEQTSSTTVQVKVESSPNVEEKITDKDNEAEDQKEHLLNELAAQEEFEPIYDE